MLQYKTKCDLPWFIFFMAMFCFYTITMVQYAAHFMIWAYCLIAFIRKNEGKIKKSTLHNMLLVCGGYGLLVLWALISRVWAYGVMEDSATLNGMIKILSIMLCMIIYVDSQHKVEAVLISYVNALTVMALLILITSPISTYGTTNFGGITQQFRNTIANAVFFGIVLVLIISPNLKKSTSILYSGLLLLTGLCTGSRRGIIQLVLIIILYALTENSLNKRIKRLLLVLLLLLVGLIILSSVPYFRETYWTRLFSIFDTSVDDAGGGEASTVGRNIYRMIAMDMFRMRPLTGFGIDGFHCYLADHTYTYTTFAVRAVYSHCNYMELLADFGILGFIFYYVLHFNILKRTLIFYKENNYFRVTLIIILATLVLDYGGISFQSNFAMYMYTILFLGVIYNNDMNFASE